MIIKTKWKNDFNLLFGPCDDMGTLVVSREDLLREAQRDRELFLMDYGHPEYDFAGEIVIEPRHYNGLARALRAYNQFRNFAEYPEGYEKLLREAQAILVRLRPKRLAAEVEHDGHGIVVRAETVEAGVS